MEWLMPRAIPKPATSPATAPQIPSSHKPKATRSAMS